MLSVAVRRAAEKVAGKRKCGWGRGGVVIVVGGEG